MLSNMCCQMSEASAEKFCAMADAKVAEMTAQGVSPGPGRFLWDSFFFLTKNHPFRNIHFSMYLDRPIFGSGAFGARKMSKRSKMTFFSCFEKNLVPEKISLDVYGARPNSLGFSDSY